MRDLYETITNKIIAQLEAGVAPWAQPWDSTKGRRSTRFDLPRNATTGRAYSGINILMLWGAGQAAGYNSPLWLTYKQAQAAGGNVRKGESGTLCVFADRFIPQKERARAAAANEEPRAVAYLKSFIVFNVEQCDGLPEHMRGAAIEPSNPSLVLPRIEALIAKSGADFRIGSAKAFYMPGPGADYVSVPPVQAFFEPINWHRTALHEMAHWTGAKHRLNREFGTRFGNTAYAREELVAEMAAAFTCAALGIEPTVRHADYIGSWLAVLKEDKRAIVSAASHASKACDYLLAYDVEHVAPEIELALAA